MDWKKRATLGSMIIAMVIMTFLGGYYLGKTRIVAPTQEAELVEVMSALDKYYYKEVKYEELLDGALAGTASSLGDPYTFYYEYTEKNAEEFVGIGISLTVVSEGLKISKIQKNSPATEAGLSVGDIIVGVNDKTYTAHGDKALSDEMKGEIGDKKKIHVKNNDRSFEVEVTIKKILTPTIESKLIGTVGYIKINEFADTTYDLFMTSLNELEGKQITKLIIDVRNNPGGSVASVNAILREFLVGTDTFIYLENVKEEKTEEFRAKKDEAKPYDVDVLINERSASASEVFALAMNRIMNYDLIGIKTYGKGVFQSDYKMQTRKDMVLHITLGYWYGPNRESIDKKGVEPTKVVETYDYYNVMPPIDKTFAYDEANTEIRNIQLMLKALGYDLRTDGYFDKNTENILSTNYESTEMTYTVTKKIYEDYKAEIVKDIHDAQLQEALK